MPSLWPCLYISGSCQRYISIPCTEVGGIISIFIDEKDESFWTQLSNDQRRENLCWHNWAPTSLTVLPHIARYSAALSTAAPNHPAGWAWPAPGSTVVKGLDRTTGRLQKTDVTSRTPNRLMELLIKWKGVKRPPCSHFSIRWWFLQVSSFKPKVTPKLGATVYVTQRRKPRFWEGKQFIQDHTGC